MTYVGDKIKEYRKKRGITQAKLAELTGIHPVSIRKYEAGMMEPRFPQLQRIADALEINAFLLKHNMLIYLVVFGGEATRLGRSLYPDLEAYIDQKYVVAKSEEEYGERSFRAADRKVFKSHARQAASAPADAMKAASAPLRPVQAHAPLPPVQEIVQNCYMADSVECEEEAYLDEYESELDERIQHLADTFQQYLLYLIERKGLSNAEVYKRALVTKQLFSKIKLNPDYHPDKATAMRLCVGAALNMDETKDLLARAGYALSPCDKRDIIFSYFIEREVFDMIEIDIALEEHGLPCFIA